MAAPDPMAGMFLARFDQRDGLRVVHHGEFAIEFHLLAIALAGGEEIVEIFLARLVGRAVQRVVKGFGDFKEARVAAEDVPACVQAQLAHQGPGDSGFRPRRRRPPSS